MKQWYIAAQIGFTYIGTIVGAGFATGQEILQFFTQYGQTGVWTITLAVILFSWLGVKIMLAAHQMGAASYEDLNRALLGERLGGAISLLILVMLFGVSSVMLAGAGSVFSEQIGLSYQLGLLITLGLAYLVISTGLKGIVAVNSIVVPAMFIVTLFIVAHTLRLPGSAYWLHYESQASLHKMWTAPLLYAAYNLSMAQAVLVPLGSSIQDRATIIRGGMIGGLGIGLMLFAGHYVLAMHMPDIAYYEIPMGYIVMPLGMIIKSFFLCILLGQIFTSLIADIYGLSLQLHQRLGWQRNRIILALLFLCYMVSQIGFSKLLSALYPLFGMLSIFWLVVMVLRRRPQ